MLDIENTNEFCYISGPISGTDDYEERFAAAEKFVREQLVLDPVNPVAETAQIRKRGLLGREELLKIDLMLLDKCTTIALMPGWEKSCGACMEYGFALRARMDTEMIPQTILQHYMTEIESADLPPDSEEDQREQDPAKQGEFPETVEEMILKDHEKSEEQPETPPKTDEGGHEAEKQKKTNRQPGKKIDLDINKIVEMRMGGMSAATIAEHFGVSTPTIRKRLEEYNKTHKKAGEEFIRRNTSPGGAKPREII